MSIDPVLVLMEELRAAEKSLQCATKIYERNHFREHGEAVNFLLATLKSLNSELLETMPTMKMAAVIELAALPASNKARPKRNVVRRWPEACSVVKASWRTK